jgi:hypothetical protein
MTVRADRNQPPFRISRFPLPAHLLHRPAPLQYGQASTLSSIAAMEHRGPREH